MGYFPNGTSGMCYEEEYCERCLHYKDPNGQGCPVMLAHLLHNYDECNNPESILHILIPLGDNGFNERCKMFVLTEA